VADRRVKSAVTLPHSVIFVPPFGGERSGLESRRGMRALVLLAAILVVAACGWAPRPPISETPIPSPSIPGDPWALRQCQAYASQLQMEIQVRAAYDTTSGVALAWLNGKALGRRGDGLPPFGSSIDGRGNAPRVNVPPETPVAACYLYRANGWGTPTVPGQSPPPLALVLVGAPGAPPLITFYYPEGSPQALALERPKASRWRPPLGWETRDDHSVRLRLLRSTACVRTVLAGGCRSCFGTINRDG
jgi:hypothetical protein